MNPREVLQAVFGYSAFRGAQEEIIAHTLAGGHSLVLMPTGMGKSLCYQIPARLFPGLTLVVSPLIALMKDQVDAARARGLRCCFINSSLSESEREARYRSLAERDYELVYVTPERFQKPKFREAVTRNEISLFAVDEAHCISEWGHDFRPDYTRISEFRELLGNPITMALTATATPEVQRDIVQQLGIAPASVRMFHHGIERANLSLEVIDLHGLASKIAAFREERSKERGPMIVYFALIDTLSKFSEAISRDRIAHLVYHGQLPERARKQNQERFMQSDSGLILATPAFGLGVDKENIRAVVHAEIPGSLEAYYQEVGRAGRDGKPARGTLLYDEDDLTTQMDFIKWANPEPEFVRSVYRLVSDHPDRVRAEGYDFLREKMNFYNRRDFRVETAVNLLQRWGSLEGTIEDRTIAAAESPSGEYLDPGLHAKRLRTQREKLLELVKFTKLPSDAARKQRLREYFGIDQSSGG